MSIVYPWSAVGRREHATRGVAIQLSSRGVGSLASADVHYLELHHLLPRIIADKQQLVRLYEAAVDRLDPAGEPGRQAHQLLDTKRDHLASLQQMAENTNTRAGA